MILSEEKNKPKEDWEILLEKWIIEVDEIEISDKIKKDLIEKIKKYRHLMNLSRKLIVLLQKHNPTENQIAQKIRNLIKLEKISLEIIPELEVAMNWKEHLKKNF